MDLDFYEIFKPYRDCQALLENELIYMIVLRKMVVGW